MLIQNLLCSVRMARSSGHMNLGQNISTCSPCLGVQRMQAFGGSACWDGKGMSTPMLFSQLEAPFSFLMAWLEREGDLQWNFKPMFSEYSHFRLCEQRRVHLKDGPVLCQEGRNQWVNVLCVHAPEKSDDVFKRRAISPDGWRSSSEKELTTKKMGPICATCIVSFHLYCLLKIQLGHTVMFQLVLESHRISLWNANCNKQMALNSPTNTIIFWRGLWNKSEFFQIKQKAWKLNWLWVLWATIPSFFKGYTCFLPSHWH